MITIYGQVRNNRQHIEWRYIHDDETHFVVDHYEGDYAFCGTYEHAKATYDYYVNRVKIDGKWVERKKE